jgi:hypothetical protein
VVIVMVLLGPMLACSEAPVVTAYPEPLPAIAAAAPVSAEPVAPLVAAARAYLGRPYAFGGRDAQLDCMGLVFRAWSDATGRRWTKLSVKPTELVRRRQLGAPVEGLAGTRSADIDYALFRPGDVLFLLGPFENPAEPALATLDGVPQWVWHMGIWSGGPRRAFVVGDHFAGRVVEESLPDYLAWHADAYAGVFVVRPP